MRRACLGAGDQVGSFNPSATVKMIQAYDGGHHLVDTNSGGPANDLYIGEAADD